MIIVCWSNTNKKGRGVCLLNSGDCTPFVLLFWIRHIFNREKTMSMRSKYWLHSHQMNCETISAVFMEQCSHCVLKCKKRWSIIKQKIDSQLNYFVVSLLEVRKVEERGFLAGASHNLSITARRKPAVGSGIPAASLPRVLWLTLCGPPQKCQPHFLSPSHIRTHMHSCRASHSTNIVFLAVAVLKTTFSAHFCLVASVKGLF